jgi:penicillin-binding protein 1A
VWAFFIYQFQAWVRRAVHSIVQRIASAVAALCLVFMVFGSAALTLIQYLSVALPPLPTTRYTVAAQFYDAKGQSIGTRGLRQETHWPIEAYPAHLIQAVLATEDRRFYNHNGLDPRGILRAALTNFRADGVVQGGSTLTQQLAKILYLDGERTVERKLYEAALALQLEKRYSKNEILKLYLDNAYLGAGNRGVAAAARFYFNKNLPDITVSEAAMLAGMLKAPVTYAPHVNIKSAQARAAQVLDNMAEVGAMPASALLNARLNPAQLIARSEPPAPDYYLDTAFEELLDLLKTKSIDTKLALKVETAFDADVQKVAENALETTLDKAKNRHVTQGAILVSTVEGGVRALVGGRDYATSQFNRATHAQRQTGSAFKPFVYAAALNQGLYRANSVVTDAPICIKNWCPDNYTRRFIGTIALADALAQSINSVPVRMVLQLGYGNANEGVRRVVTMTERLGMATPRSPTPAMALGASETTLFNMVRAYGVFARGGLRLTPHTITRISDTNDTPLYTREADNEPILAGSVAAEMNALLARVPTHGTGKRADLDKVHTAGKTGTTSQYRDAWYMGFSGNFVTGVWLGNDDFSPMDGVTGGQLPAQIFKTVMTRAHEGVEERPIAGVTGAASSYANVGNLRTETLLDLDVTSTGSVSANVISQGSGIQVISGGGGFREENGSAGGIRSARSNGGRIIVVE